MQYVLYKILNTEEWRQEEDVIRVQICKCNRTGTYFRQNIFIYANEDDLKNILTSV